MILAFLLQYKRELAAKAAGLTFVHHTELKSTREDNSGSECEATPEDEGKSESSNELSRLDLPAQMDALTVTAKPTNQETPMKPSPTTQVLDLILLLRNLVSGPCNIPPSLSL